MTSPLPPTHSLSQPPAPPPPRPGRALLLIVAAIVLALDQFTKALVVRNLALGEAWAPFPSLSWLFTVTHTTNTGAAFGLFRDGGNIFIVIAIIISAAIVLFYDRLPVEHRAVRFALGLQLGGALGNLIDRLTRGSVVDFIDFKFFWIFNVADSALVVGVAILALYLGRDDHREPRMGDHRGSLASNHRPIPSAADDRGQLPADDHRKTLVGDHRELPADDQQHSPVDDHQKPIAGDHQNSPADDHTNSPVDDHLKPLADNHREPRVGDRSDAAAHDSHPTHRPDSAPARPPADPTSGEKSSS